MADVAAGRGGPLPRGQPLLQAADVYVPGTDMQGVLRGPFRRLQPWWCRLGEGNAVHITHGCTHLIVPLQAQGVTSTPPASSSCSSQQILHVLGSALASLAAEEDGPAVALSVLLMPNASMCGLGKRMAGATMPTQAQWRRSDKGSCKTSQLWKARAFTCRGQLWLSF